MKIISFLFLMFSGVQVCSIQAQISLHFVSKTTLKADRFVGMDEFNATYFIKDNSLIKETEDNVLSFQQNQLGEISSVDLTNPLKIIVFYKDYNTIVFLDNTLNPLTDAINFSTQEIGLNISFVGRALDHQLWLYSEDDNRLHLWDYQTKKITFSSKPLSFLKKSAFSPTQMLSSLTDLYFSDHKGLLKFNKYAQFESSINFNEFSQIVRLDDEFIYLKNNRLYHQTLTQAPSDLALRPYVKAQQLYLRNEHLYIFDGQTIFSFKIIKN